MNREKKLEVLARIARALNAEKLTWAVGASLLLYLRGIVEDFHDIDLFVLEAEAPRVREILDRMGRRQPSERDSHYATRCFLEYEIDGVELDVMAGFAIAEGGRLHDCALQRDQIAGYAAVLGQQIPLQELSLWVSYYTWMGRREKAEKIRKALQSGGNLSAF